jgi:hypothetical protein
MFNSCRGFRWIDLHPAYGIVFSSLLHGAIMTVFAHFALFHSDQGSTAFKMADDACMILIRGHRRIRLLRGNHRLVFLLLAPVIPGFRFVEPGDAFMLGWRLWYIEVSTVVFRGLTGVI